MSELAQAQQLKRIANALEVIAKKMPDKPKASPAPPQPVPPRVPGRLYGASEGSFTP